MQLPIKQRVIRQTPPGKRCWFARFDADGNELASGYAAKGIAVVDEELVAVDAKAEADTAKAEFQAELVARKANGKVGEA